MHAGLLALAAALLFSSKSVLIKLAYAAGGNAEALLALRMLIALPIYLSVWLVARLRGSVRPVSRSALVTSAGIGVLGYAVSSYLDMKGLEYVSAPVERLILFTYPFFVAVMGAGWFGHRLQRRALAGLFVSYAGLALVLFEGLAGTTATVGAIGVVLVFGSAWTYALFQQLASTAVRGVGAVAFTCISMSAAALCTIAACGIAQPTDGWFAHTDVLVYAGLLAVLGTVLPSFLLSAALKTLSPQAHSAIGAVGPVFTILLSMAILGDSMGPLAMLGSVFVVAGATWFVSKDSGA
ncbi:DMT family transporter [Hydrogenophaga sp. SNF1]|nr:DMT family transporter [Hydrogenophaga sp. SNF1]WQB85561.1 DMT family transporter [Hydrogenophaga sp. SNF1]